MRFINQDNVSDYAFINMDALTFPVKAVCVDFHGYTDATMFSESNEKAKRLGEKGIAWVFPYYSVWAWMSKSSQEFNEQVLDAVYQKLQLSDTVPLIITGGSMGGLGEIIYSIESKHNIAACGAACPCCDVLDRFHCKDGFARTFIRAVADYDMPMEEALKTISPMHRIGDMRKIPYFLVNCCDDEVFQEAQLDEYAEKLKGRGHDVRGTSNQRQ